MKHRNIYICTLLFSMSVVSGTLSAQEKWEDKQVEVGYGQAKFSHTASGVSVVSGEELQKYAGVNLGNALHGLLPGLIGVEQTGDVGAFAPTFYIRGKKTYGDASNLPLVYVDGFERDMNKVSMDDVASITVLKDAAATAIYGVRGANGVILVNTKRGVQGKMKINVSVEQGFQMATKIPEFVSSAEYARFYNQALKSDELAVRFTPEDIAGYEQGGSLLYPDVKWEKELLNKFSPVTDLNVAAQGGSDKAQYYVSLGYIHNSGLFKGSDKNEDYSTNALADQFNFRTNLDLLAFDNLEIRADIAGNIKLRNLPYYSTNDYWTMMYKYPQHEFPLYVAEGIYGGTPVYRNNPLAYLNESGYRRVNDRYIQTGISAKYNFSGILKGLSFGMKYAYDNAYSNTESYSKYFFVKDILGLNIDGTPILSEDIGKATSLTYKVDGDSQSRRSSYEAHLAYQRSFKGGHDLNAMLMYYQDKLVKGAENPYRNQFVSGRFNYAYRDKYLAELTFSYSGSEAFAKKNRFTWFPAVALGWVVSEENFMKDNKYVDFLKLRASAGLSGNSSLGERFSYRQLYSSSGEYYFGTGITTEYGLAESTLANLDLKPEKSFKFDFGVDARLLKDLSLSATYFFERRFNILTSKGDVTSTIIGASLPRVNAGVTHTNGIEAALKYGKQYKEWGFYAGYNLTLYRNKIKSIMEQPLQDNSTYQYQRGTAVGQQLGLQFVGFFKDEEDIKNSPTQEYGTVKPGDMKYRDVNKDGVVNDYDRTYSDAYSIPNTEMSLSAGANWKGFDVSALITAQLGTETYLGDAKYLFWPFTGDGARISTYVAERNPWTPETADIARYPRLTTMSNTNNYQRSDFWTMDGRRIRLRYIELGYTLPQVLTQKIAMSKLRFYVRGNNILTFAKLKYVDPAAMGGTPYMKSFHLGVNINF